MSGTLGSIIRDPLFVTGVDSIWVRFCLERNENQAVIYCLLLASYSVWGSNLLIVSAWLWGAETWMRSATSAQARCPHLSPPSASSRTWGQPMRGILQITAMNYWNQFLFTHVIYTMDMYLLNYVHLDIYGSHQFQGF